MKKNILLKIYDRAYINSYVKIKSAIFKSKRHKSLNNTDITIISNNCIGGCLYSDFGLKFKSPFIYLFMESDDFIKICNDLKYYLGLPLLFCPSASTFNYPIGQLGDVTVHFFHYKSEAEALNSWKKRVARINYDNLFVIHSTRDRFECEQLSKFEIIPYKKVLFSHLKLEENDIVVCKEFVGAEVFPESFVTKRLYHDYFDFIDWFNGKSTNDCKKS